MGGVLGVRVILTAEALVDERLWTDLDRILHTVDDGWHLWEIPDPAALENTAWLRRGREALQDLFERAARRSVWQGRGSLHTRRVFVRSETGNREHSNSFVSEPRENSLYLGVDSARRFLGRPLRILMENVLSDGVFLDTVLDVLGSAELRVLRDCKPPALEYHSAGGSGEIPKQVDYHLDDPAWRGIPSRLFVFTDSDGLRPGERDPKAQRVEDCCKERGVPYHILSKRCVENYLPQEALEAWAALPENVRSKPRAAALARLDMEQRDHFPMKNAFPKGIPDAQVQLFSPLRWSEEDRQLFVGDKRGFGKNIVLVFRDHRSAITADALRRRCRRPSEDDIGQATELDKLIDLICAEL
jgi:hypothetical protein